MICKRFEVVRGRRPQAVEDAIEVPVRLALKAWIKHHGEEKQTGCKSNLQDTV
jgi:hypothetical protein